MKYQQTCQLNVCVHIWLANTHNLNNPRKPNSKHRLTSATLIWQGIKYVLLVALASLVSQISKMFFFYYNALKNVFYKMTFTTVAMRINRGLNVCFSKLILVCNLIFATLIRLVGFKVHLSRWSPTFFTVIRVFLYPCHVKFVDFSPVEEC